MSELTNKEKKDIRNEVKEALKQENKTDDKSSFTIKEEIPKVERIA